MTLVDTMGPYVRRRLDAWGDEYALHRDCEYLGYASKSRMQILFEHGGEMPPRPTGFKPVEINLEAQQIEDIVAEIGRHNHVMAIVLRAYYCGQGRRKVERWETANLLLANAKQRMLSQDSYMDVARRGEDRVYGLLLGTARAAA
jgi:hypothetical protein